MTQYEGIRTASDIELHEAYRRLVVQGNCDDAPLRRAAQRWLGSVCNEINRRYPPEPNGFGFMSDPGDEIEN